jgi:endoglucanase
VDAALERGLYTIINAHHEAWFDLTDPGYNYTAIEEQFYNLWFQIGTKLGCKSSLLAFEPINEPGANTADQIAELNKIQQIFIQALADSGGFNSERVVTLIGPEEGLDIPGNLHMPFSFITTHHTTSSSRHGERQSGALMQTKPLSM